MMQDDIGSEVVDESLKTIDRSFKVADKIVNITMLLNEILKNSIQGASGKTLKLLNRRNNLTKLREQGEHLNCIELKSADTNSLVAHCVEAKIDIANLKHGESNLVVFKQNDKEIITKLLEIIIQERLKISEKEINIKKEYIEKPLDAIDKNSTYNVEAEKTKLIKDKGNIENKINECLEKAKNLNSHEKVATKTKNFKKSR